MERVSRKLNLPTSAWGTACVIFHKFVFAADMPQTSQISIYALASLFIAAKVDDNPRDLGSLAQAFVYDKLGIVYPQSDPKVIAAKIAEKEFEVLCAINFDLRVELAFTQLPQLKHHFWHRDAELLFKKAEAFLTECYRTPACIRLSPSVLALVALALTEDHFKIDLQASFRFDSRSHSTEASSVLSDPEDYEAGQTQEASGRYSPYFKLKPAKDQSVLVKRPPEVLRLAPATQPRASTPFVKLMTASSFEKDEGFHVQGSGSVLSFEKDSSQLKQTCVNFHLSPIKLPLKMRRHLSEVLVLDKSSDPAPCRPEEKKAGKLWHHVFGDDTSLDLIKREMQTIQNELNVSSSESR